MITVTDDKEQIVVDFLNDSNERMSGKLLTYQISGEACVLLGTQRAWIPFSRLSRKSRKKLLMPNMELSEKSENTVIMNLKVIPIITLFVVLTFIYYYGKFSV